MEDEALVVTPADIPEGTVMFNKGHTPDVRKELPNVVNTEGSQLYKLQNESGLRLGMTPDAFVTSIENASQDNPHALAEMMHILRQEVVQIQPLAKDVEYLEMAREDMKDPEANYLEPEEAEERYNEAREAVEAKTISTPRQVLAISSLLLDQKLDAMMKNYINTYGSEQREGKSDTWGEYLLGHIHVLGENLAKQIDEISSWSSTHGEKLAENSIKLQGTQERQQKLQDLRQQLATLPKAA